MSHHISWQIIVSTKNYFYVLLTLGLFSACQTNSTENDREEKAPSALRKDPEKIKQDSILEEPLNKEIPRSKPEITTEKVIQPELITDRDDIYLGDPFEDPDYIGTPCGDFLNGKCTRHHHKDELLEKSDHELDSLKH